ncbi:MAG: trypsin-like peptidase domain-containing protein, partial [Candidatus Zixiibacteriota bacterium]
MNSGFFSPKTEKNKKQKYYIIIYIAVVFLLMGIILSANFDITPISAAQKAHNPAESDLYPIVERNGEFESPFVQVVENVKNAVVNISAQSIENNLPWWYQGPNYTVSSGSGFFFREDGYILTNNHVVKDAREMTVTTASGYHYDAMLIGADSLTDLAVLKIEPDEETISIISFGNSDEIKVGDWAIAIGNPFPQQGLDRTVTVGVISAKGRSNLHFGNETPTYQNYIQTDASINPGNSGGPLLNLKGECVGVNAAISSPTGVSVGIGFAIPINIARSVVPDLILTGKVSRGWLGVWLGKLTEKEARRQGLDALRGVRIDSVFTNSPADKAGIKSGDIILTINDQPVNNNNQLSLLVSQVKQGQSVSIEVVRKGERFTLSSIIGDRDTFLANMEESEHNNSDDFQAIRWLGMELVTLTDEITKALDIEPVEGVLVRRVYPGSP